MQGMRPLTYRIALIQRSCYAGMQGSYPLPELLRAQGLQHQVLVGRHHLKDVVALYFRM